jgi:hypothetical protein
MRKFSFLLATMVATATLTAQNHWYVSPSGSNANSGTSAGSPFQTINHAASVATAGDVLHLAAATFGDEQGNVLLGTKNLTLVGAGMGVTIVKAHTSSDVMLPAGLLLTPTIEAHRVAMTIDGTARLDVRDLTLDNGFSVPGTGRAYCLWIGGGADGTFDDVEFTNARSNPISGIQGPLGVNIRGHNAGNVTNVTLRNCWVHEYGKGGVVANFNANLVMDDCRVDGYGHAALGLAAQNGIQVSRGATCTIRRTTVTDNWYEPATVVATGILFFDAGSPALVEDCNFGNCQSALYFFGGGFPYPPFTSPATVRRCNVHGAEYGIYSLNQQGLTITDNSFAVRRSGDNNDAWDDAGANTWSGNYYSSVTTAGPYLLPGTGAVTDATALPGCRTFAPAVATALPGGHAPVDMVVVNLDADSDADVAAVSQTATTPALAIGLNTGGAFAMTGLAFGNSDGSAVALVAGEFDGAAGTDLAALTVTVPPVLGENKVYVFANNGAGVFSLLHTHTIAGATSASGLAAGDVDGDGRADLVVTDAGSAGLIAGSATVLRNNGTGTGFTAVALTAAYTAACRGAAVRDLDGDSDADIAVTEGNAFTGRLHLFAGNGLGGFAAYGSSPLTVAANTNRVLATDLEGDGDFDLLVSSTRDAFGLLAGDVEVLENSGAAAFVKSEYRVDRGPTVLAAGDFDDDSDLDSQRRDAAVVNLAAGTISVLGSWTRGAGYGTGGICATGGVPTAVGIADIGGDGYQDLVWCDAAAGTVNVKAGLPQARADGYGAGCEGTAGRIPFLYPVGIPPLPVQPNATFGLALNNARPLSFGVFAVGLGAAPIAPCSLLITSIGSTWGVVTNVRGESAIPLPIPLVPPVIGFPLYAQAGVFDPNANAPFFAGVSLTRGLRLRVGY